MTGNVQAEHVKLTAAMSPSQKNRALNDHFRKAAKGGIVSISWGIHMLGRAGVDNIVKRLGGTEGDSSCDVGSVHDSGGITVSNRRIHWKIDYYNRDMSGGSENPASPLLTTRVMTVFLANEY